VVKRFRFASLDDEPVAHDVLRMLLRAHPDFVDHGRYLVPARAQAGLAAEPVDLLFLDIQMPQCTGLEFLAACESPPATILVTAHAQYALDAFALGVRDYLLKPVSAERLAQCLDRIRPLLASASSPVLRPAHGKLAFAEGRGHALESPDAIAAIDAEGNFSRLTLLDGAGAVGGTRFVSESLKSLEARLGPFGFVRVHKCHLINLLHLFGVGAKSVQLSAGLSRPLGRTYRQALEEQACRRRY
jgi:two-component system LytT family response regulator